MVKVKLIEGPHNQRALAHLRDKGCQVVLLIGGAGLGKTRLISEVATRKDLVLDPITPGITAAMIDAFTAKACRVFATVPTKADFMALDPAVRTRLVNGATVELEEWPPAARRALFDAMLPNAPDGAADLLCAELMNPREIQGAATTLAEAMKYGADEVAKALQTLVPIRTMIRMKIEPATVKAEVGDLYGVTPFEIDSQIRTKRCAMARHVAIYVLYELSGETLVDIGKAFGGRDHSTVLHAVNKITRETLRDKVLEAQVDRLKRRVAEASGYIGVPVSGRRRYGTPRGLVRATA
jgi:chromosomal replication initiation ATPase DnaA